MARSTVTAPRSPTDIHFRFFHLPFLNLPGVALVFCFFLAEPFVSGSCNYKKWKSKLFETSTKLVAAQQGKISFSGAAVAVNIKYSSSSAALKTNKQMF